MVRSSKLNTRRTQGDDGVVIIIFAFALLVILIMLAIAIDLGNQRQYAREAQGSTDAAALAAAQKLPVTNETTPASDAVFADAAKYAAEDFFPSGSAPAVPAPTCVKTNSPSLTITCTYVLGTGADAVTLTVTSPYTAVTYGGIAPEDLVYVRGCGAQATFFAGAANGTTSLGVCRESVARNVGGITITRPGVIALKADAPCIDYTVKGSQGSTLTVSPGSVIANCESSPPNKIAGAKDGIDAAGFYSVGSCPTPEECVGNRSTPTYPISAPVLDPLSGLVDPMTSPDWASFQSFAGKDYNKLGCLNGLYYVTGTTNIDMIPTCSGATSFTYLVAAGVSTNLKSEIDQVAPATGYYKGISLFLAHGNTSTVEWNGNNKGAAVYRGTVYAPDGQIDWGGNIDVEITGQVVAYTYLLHGGGGPKNEGFLVNVPSSTADIVLPADTGLQA